MCNHDMSNVAHAHTFQTWLSDCPGLLSEACDVRFGVIELNGWGTRSSSVQGQIWNIKQRLGLHNPDSKLRNFIYGFYGNFVEINITPDINFTKVGILLSI
jgi:hypothetical protein